MIKRTFSMVTSFLLILVFSSIIFVSLPGDFTNSQLMSRDKKLEIKQELGLDKPKPMQIIHWNKKLITFNLGNSFLTGLPVSTSIKIVLKNSASLYILSLGISIILGIILGALTAYKKGTVFDSFTRVFVLLGISVPVVVVATIVLFIFIYLIRVPIEYFYTEMNNRIAFMFMVFLNLPLFTKYSRAMMIEVLSEDYIRTAKSKGLSSFRIIFKHGIRNSLVGLIGTIGVSLNNIVFTSCLIEMMLGYPGLGYLVATATFKRDYPLMLGSMVVLASITLLFNYIFDILIQLIDPRVNVIKEG
ncbi:ABC transporter permease [Clostridium polynesiense]|uniref:ABC transporter permease n=1 Tax=Clostridium polynesiense TaxID=1325933 RepID=UPI00164D0F3C|nr:ABC transporter permease [Clostridium polynesiense]